MLKVTNKDIVFIVDFEHISHLVVTPMVNFQQIIAGWV